MVRSVPGINNVSGANAFQVATPAKGDAKFSASAFLAPAAAESMPKMAAVPHNASGQAGAYPSAALLQAMTKFVSPQPAFAGDKSSNKSMAAAMFGANVTSNSDLSDSQKITSGDGGGASSDHGDERHS